MTHKQWFNNVLHLHPVPEEGADFPKMQKDARCKKSQLFQVAVHFHSRHPQPIST